MQPPYSNRLSRGDTIRSPLGKFLNSFQSTDVPLHVRVPQLNRILQVRADRAEIQLFDGVRKTIGVELPVKKTQNLFDSAADSCDTLRPRCIHCF